MMSIGSVEWKITNKLMPNVAKMEKEILWEEKALLKRKSEGSYYV